jgi:acyl carrier protein
MSAQRTSFGKLERDRNKKARAAAKRERRQGRGSEPDATADDSRSTAGSESGGGDSTEVLELLAAIHERYDAGTISLEELEERKAELLARLEID